MTSALEYLQRFPSSPKLTTNTDKENGFHLDVAIRLHTTKVIFKFAGMHAVNTLKASKQPGFHYRRTHKPNLTKGKNKSPSV